MFRKGSKGRQLTSRRDGRITPNADIRESDNP